MISLSEQTRSQSRSRLWARTRAPNRRKTRCRDVPSAGPMQPGVNVGCQGHKRSKDNEAWWAAHDSPGHPECWCLHSTSSSVPRSANVPSGHRSQRCTTVRSSTGCAEQGGSAPGQRSGRAAAGACQRAIAVSCFRSQLACPARRSPSR